MLPKPAVKTKRRRAPHGRNARQPLGFCPVFRGWNQALGRAFGPVAIASASPRLGDPVFQLQPLGREFLRADRQPFVLGVEHAAPRVEFGLLDRLTFAERGTG